MSENNKIDVEACSLLLEKLADAATSVTAEGEDDFTEYAALLRALKSALPGLIKSDPDVLATRILNGLEATANRFHDLGEQAEADRQQITARYDVLRRERDFASASYTARHEFVARLLRSAGQTSADAASVLDRDLDAMQQSGKHPGASSVPNIEDFESRESIHEASAMPVDDPQYSRLLSEALGTLREEGDLPMMLALADECETWGNMKWATRLREIALNGESFESFQARSAAISAPPSPAVPNIEDGGCDICDDPNCYRNQPEVVNNYTNGVEDFFVKLGETAREKDIAANGPNPPLTLRSLHDVNLNMNEILLVMRDMLTKKIK